MRKYFIMLSFVFFFVILCSCGVSSRGDYPGYGDVPANFVIGEYEIDKETNLTCIAHDDNEYYDAWTEIVYKYYGAFNYYFNYYPVKTNKRLTIEAPKGFDFEVSLLNEEKEVVYTNKPNAFGVCYLFPNWYSNTYQIIVKYQDKNTLEEIVEEFSITNKITLKIETKVVEKEIIDLMFVVDTTATMNDELEYLKNEIADVVERVKSFNDCIVNVAILLYKDKGEIYETLYSEFTTNIEEQLAFLQNKIAYGGGDFEEAVEVAIEEAYSKSWSDSSTKLLIHIGDAPCHDENIDDWYNAVLNLCSKGIRLITVASSGINKKTEYLFRSMTLISNGHYIALTIEYLDNCLVRLINCYHNGINY